ncbi:MAG: hypothetical protein KY444_11725 [Gemmatimonadetes bacterium]|nr:hypothetical protein [Gemmatimonadota bacterium]
MSKGEQAAFPQARLVGLAECGTHALFAAQIGKYTESEATLTERLLTTLTPGMLLLAVASPLMTRDVAVAASLLIRFATLWFGVLLGAFVLFLYRRNLSPLPELGDGSEGLAPGALERA